MGKLITLFLVVTAAFTAYAVITPNHLFIG